MRFWSLPNQVTTLSVLKDARMHEIYRKAAEILGVRGMSKNLVYDPYTKQVDIMGALLLACGASERLMADGFTEPQDVGVPPVNQGKVLVAYEYLESALSEDPSEWCGKHKTHEAAVLLVKLSDRIEISVRIPESIRRTN